MAPVAPAARTGVEWFSMIISYLKVRSMAVWFCADPESSYACFEEAWPFILDELMSRATRASIEQLQTTVRSNLN